MTRLTSLPVSMPASFNLWLASPEARFLKGRFLWANWDIEELKKNAKDIEAGQRFSVGLVGWPFDQDGFKVLTEGSSWN